MSGVVDLELYGNMPVMKLTTGGVLTWGQTYVYVSERSKFIDLTPGSFPSYPTYFTSNVQQMLTQDELSSHKWGFNSTRGTMLFSGSDLLVEGVSMSGSLGVGVSEGYTGGVDRDWTTISDVCAS